MIKSSSSMVRQYRIERFNGMEILVCECYERHLFSQAEHKALVEYNEEHLLKPVSNSEFRIIVNEALAQHGVESYFGLKWPIPVYDSTPCVILRGPVVDNRIASLQVEYIPSVGAATVYDEVLKFYQLMDSRHWRDAIDHQLEKYGSLFEPQDD